MISVRYPNGTVVEYADANFLTHGEGYRMLSQKKDGAEVRKIAFILDSSGATIEFVQASRVNKQEDAEAAIKTLLAKGRTLTRYSDADLLKKLKRYLSNYDCRRRVWK